MNWVPGILIGLLMWGCASQTTPNGGPKDETPPLLLKSTPSQNEKNFKGKIIELTFDELVKLNNPNDEIIITPSLGKGTRYIAKNNKVTIEPQSAWKDSTTFSVSFRNAIQDVNEGNPAEDLRLAFSTGTYLDSLSISGMITQPLTETIPDKLTVGIFESDTFDIFKHTPEYFTKSKKNGSFSILNLKPGHYRIYAFDDKNKNLKVESQTEKFGLLPETIDLTENSDSIHLSVFLVDSRPLKITSIRNSGTISTVKFNKNVKSYSINKQSYQSPPHTFGDNQTEVIIYNPLQEADSIKIDFTAQDSVLFSVDTSFYVKKIQTKIPNQPFIVSFEDGTIDVETGEFKLLGSYNKPVQTVTFDSTYIKIDSLDSILFKPEDIKFDSIKKQLTLTKKIENKLLNKPKLAPPIVNFGKAFLISIQNDSSKYELKKTTLIKEEDTGNILVTVETQFPNYIVQLLSSQNKVIQSVRNSKNPTFKKLPPQDYKLRVIIDTNKNGFWDPQNIFQNTPPEQTIYYKSPDKKYTFPLRAGWDFSVLLKF